MKYKILIFVLCLLVFFGLWNICPSKTLDAGTTPPIDKILINKSQRKLTLLSKGKEIKTYRVSLGRAPVGRKHFEGDKKTPEGTYRVTHHNPKSSYHLSLGISYPNREDVAFAAKYGKSAGSFIMIHGAPNRFPFFGKMHRLFDWTGGCIAVTNSEIEEIYNLVKDGTTIEILP